MEDCQSCFYYRNENHEQECRRFPAPLKTDPDYWCGEFKEKSAAEPEANHENPQQNFEISMQPKPQDELPSVDETLALGATKELEAAKKPSTPIKPVVKRKRKIRR